MEEDVFVQLYEKYHICVYRYLFSLTRHHPTAEDLSQETFVRALSVLQTPGVTIKAWLLTVAHNLYVDHVKKNRRLTYPDPEYFDNISQGDTETLITDKEHRREIYQLVLDLPEKQRQAVLLCIVNELSHQEAGKILGLTGSAVTNLIYRARKTLKTRRNKHEQ
ncbi:RNA polymerase sigma factor [Alkalibacter rhizosphaerae]|uniref:RNA polymerase sigma factor n=1 Tax=Alkalibacter rhizosphaerae TaxID=2815577 RepID=A0A975AIH5_9FIRM|nr:RNA polymerase sigma factor [Alkalibacter rhizosphaerae]QSX08530.1 RNA polymerase sigma factor [Alkalibacter rhizosphaerae]